MQKRSHTLLARTLLEQTCGFPKRRFATAFLLGSFQPDCNPLSYLKGWRQGRLLMGHNYSNSHRYIRRRIRRLQKTNRWNLWHYYTLGKLTHYLADAFTFAHNENGPATPADHHRYETLLREQLPIRLSGRLRPAVPHRDPAAALDALHRKYRLSASFLQRDIDYIWEAAAMVTVSLLPACR